MSHPWKKTTHDSEIGSLIAVFLLPYSDRHQAYATGILSRTGSAFPRAPCREQNL